MDNLRIGMVTRMAERINQPMNNYSNHLIIDY